MNAYDLKDAEGDYEVGLDGGRRDLLAYTFNTLACTDHWVGFSMFEVKLDE